ncbi:MAG: multidrug effflux MFS transporter [Paraglaciecola sp.]|nr:multidrug effflux MFS transporter [Paraglaciecola sp.]
MKLSNPLPLLILMVIFSPLAIDIFLPALPIMASELSVSLTQMQWSISAFILSMGFGQLISGPMADKYGRKPVAIIGVVIYGISSLFAANADSFEFLLAARLLQGLGACAIVVAAFACVRDRYDALRSGMMYSYLNGAICCIPAMAPLLGNVLTEYFGWRSNFDFMALYAAIAGVIIMLLLTESRPTDTVVSKKLFSLKPYIKVLVHPVFLFNSIIVMLAMSIILAYVTSSPAWLMVKLGLDREAFVFWFSINAVLNIVGCVVAPRILLNWGARLTIGLGMISIIGSGFLMLALRDWQDAMGFMLPVMLSSLGFSMLMGACAGQALSSFGQNAGTASALLGFMQMSGSALVVFLLQMLPIRATDQLSILMLSFIPVYALWKSAAIKKHIFTEPV